MFRLLLLFVTITTVLTACSSGQTAFRHGHFDLAVKQASHRLNGWRGLTKRGYTIAPLVLKQAFARAYEEHQTAIRKLSSPANTDAFRWEVVHTEYEKLQTLTDNARTCTACADWLAAYPVSYADRQLEIRQLAAGDRYDVAEQAFAYREDNRQAAKDAYVNYQKALSWVSGFRQAHAKAEDALPFAILRVVVEPLSPTSEISPGDNQELQNLIFRQINPTDAPSKFVRLYHPDESAGDGFPIHQAVQMQVSNYQPYSDNTSSSSTTVYSSQTYKVGEKKINDSTKVDIMEKVSGTLTTYQRTIRAELSLRLRAIDTQTGQTRWEDTIWETRDWKTEWQTFSGDDRALNGHSLASASLFAPSRWSLYDSMRDELADDVVRRLRQKYSSD
ncbi:hypothetical protein [Spirosoma endbachense]|uniref:Lipoprotein n=1 Tax=Spirosoma endbachense TaxID=2666025 RepID=A0A6P1VUH5_9BACT|nr:hypothetical protein [Spirosoma endbachense]QHV95026.1 hypothetical protein GJR95_08315 [Spirosoma endbachense]